MIVLGEMFCLGVFEYLNLFDFFILVLEMWVFLLVIFIDYNYILFSFIEFYYLMCNNVFIYGNVIIYLLLGFIKIFRRYNS